VSTNSREAQWFTPAATAAQQATRDVPIVMTTGDPVATKLVDSLARPGGNVTGISGLAPELAEKCVELVREVLPSSRRAVALINARDTSSKPILDRILSGAKAVGLSVDPIMIDNAGGLEVAFANMIKAPPDAIIAQPSLPTTIITELALKYRLPAFSPFRPFADAGGLLSYWLDEASALRNIEASVFQGIPKGIEVLENAGIAASAVHFLVFLRCVHPARHPARLICFASAWRRSSTSATR
jgi:putative ABC transport system substrate-binding protein